MRIILDECVPSIVKRRLPALNIITVQEIGWSGIKNGELLKHVAAEFDLFITSDKNLRHQQNLAVLNIAVLLLPSNQVPAIEAILTDIEEAIKGLSDKTFVEL